MRNENVRQYRPLWNNGIMEYSVQYIEKCVYSRWTKSGIMCLIDMRTMMRNIRLATLAVPRVSKGNPYLQIPTLLTNVCQRVPRVLPIALTIRITISISNTLSIGEKEYGNRSKIHCLAMWRAQTKPASSRNRTKAGLRPS